MKKTYDFTLATYDDGRHAAPVVVAILPDMTPPGRPGMGRFDTTRQAGFEAARVVRFEEDDRIYDTPFNTAPTLHETTRVHFTDGTSEVYLGKAATLGQLLAGGAPGGGVTLSLVEVRPGSHVELSVPPGVFIHAVDGVGASVVHGTRDGARYLRITTDGLDEEED